MKFLKRLFSSKHKNSTQKNKIGVDTQEYFEERYTEEQENHSIIDGSLKMIRSYFIDNKIDKKVKNPINHPLNLDQVVDDGMGFQLYCKAFEMEDTMIIGMLATAFSEFMKTSFGFKSYRDHEPEYPLRSMTLKYNKNGIVLSLYPYEYALKVLNYETTFEQLYTKVKAHLENMPNVEKLISKMEEE